MISSTYGLFERVVAQSEEALAVAYIPIPGCWHGFLPKPNQAFHLSEHSELVNLKCYHESEDGTEDKRMR